MEGGDGVRAEGGDGVRAEGGDGVRVEGGDGVRWRVICLGYYVDSILEFNCLSSRTF